MTLVWPGAGAFRVRFEELGFEGVATCLASGNVIFHRPDSESANLAEEIEEHLAGAPGYWVKKSKTSPSRLLSVL